MVNVLWSVMYQHSVRMHKQVQIVKNRNWISSFRKQDIQFGKQDIQFGKQDIQFGKQDIQFQKTRYPVWKTDPVCKIFWTWSCVQTIDLLSDNFNQSRLSANVSGFVGKSVRNAFSNVMRTNCSKFMVQILICISWYLFVFSDFIRVPWGCNRARILQNCSIQSSRLCLLQFTQMSAHKLPSLVTAQSVQIDKLEPKFSLRTSDWICKKGSSWWLQSVCASAQRRMLTISGSIRHFRNAQTIRARSITARSSQFWGDKLFEFENSI